MLQQAALITIPVQLKCQQKVMWDKNYVSFFFFCEENYVSYVYVQLHLYLIDPVGIREQIL